MRAGDGEAEYRINTRSSYCCCAVFLAAAAAAANLYVADRELDQLLQKGCACVCVLWRYFGCHGVLLLNPELG